MTAHSAKGLDGNDRRRHGQRHTAKFGARNLDANLRPRPHVERSNRPKKKSAGLDDFSHRQFRRAERAREARSARLLYVAMTRAGEHSDPFLFARQNKPSNWAKIVDALQPSTDISIVETDAEPPLCCLLRAPTAAATMMFRRWIALASTVSTIQRST